MSAKVLLRCRASLPPAAAVFLCSLLLSACAGRGPAPIEGKSVAPEPTPGVVRTAPALRAAAARIPEPPLHVVVRGDTLHGIAWRYGLDFRDLVRWNRLRNPDLIVVGQKLRLAAPEPAPRATASRTPAASPAPRPVQPQAPPPSPPAQPARPLSWQWPAEGKVTRAQTVSGSRGVEIRGTRGQSVKAAAGGAVVYSGSGLRGYGELIIIKHDETYLSAYAHNEARLVGEGEHVRGGQQIARMGDTDSRDVMLHFEIRRNGKTVDPFRYLPRR